MTEAKTQPGRDGVVVAQTVRSEVDGEAGRLIVRGHPIEELAGNVPFEEVARQLWEGLAPEAADAPRTAAEVQAALGRARTVAFASVAALRGTVAGDRGAAGGSRSATHSGGDGRDAGGAPPP